MKRRSSKTPEYKVLSVADRKKYGKELRQVASRKEHGDTHFHRDKDQLFRVMNLSNKGRLADLVPVRHTRMLISPFTFYRGSAALMAYDLSTTPDSTYRVQICGDCHVMNFGGFATPERNIIFDINDFDETIPGPWEWDIKRLCASLVLSARSTGLGDSVGMDTVKETCFAYREMMNEFSEMSNLEVWYHRVHIEDIVRNSIHERGRVNRMVKAAIAKSAPEVVLDKLTEVVKGKRRFKKIPGILYRLGDIHLESMNEAFNRYVKTLPEDRRVLLGRYQVVDASRKVVGIGSVGTLCGVILLSASESDFLVLQVKEARASALESFVGKSKYEHPGQRVVEGQRLMQAASDMMLGWTTGIRIKRDFFVRQLRDVKMAPNPEVWTRATMPRVGYMLGRILAKSHARSGDPAIMAGYLGNSDTFDLAMAKFAKEYADQTERDFKMFKKLCKDQRLVALPD